MLRTRQRRLLLGALICISLLQAAAAAVIAGCIQRVFDGLLVGPSTEPSTLTPIILVFAVTAVSAGLLEVLRSWAGERLGLNYIAEIRESMFGAILRASHRTLHEKRDAGLLLPFVGDLTAIKKWVSDGLVRLVAATATATILIAALSLQNAALGLTAGIIVLLAALLVARLGSPLSRAVSVMRSRRGAITNFVAATMRATRTVQAFDRFDRETSRLIRRNKALQVAGQQLALLAGWVGAVVHGAGTLLTAGILVVGVIELQRGAISIGVVAGALSLTALLAQAVRDLGVSYELWRRAKVSFDKISSMSSLQAALTDARPGKPPRGPARLELKDVGLQGILRGVNAEAKAGDIVNVVGASGSGKSTLLMLVARLRDPDVGKVRYSGRDLRRIAPKAWRRRIGIASGAVPLMRGTIEMNLRYRCRSASEDDVLSVIRICGLETMLKRLPDGRSTKLSDGAPELSISDSQKLQIARAMLGRPRILVLDEVDSHVEPETLLRIVDSLRERAGIVVMAAVSPEMREAANVVWRIDGGELWVDPIAPSQEGVTQISFPRTFRIGGDSA